MSRFSVIEGRDVTPEDIGEARELDLTVYEAQYHVTTEQCLAWNRENGRIYTMVRDRETGRIVAYCNLSPVTDEYYERIAAGAFNDTELPPEAIVDYALPGLYSLYFSSVVVHPDYRDTKVFVMLYRAMREKIAALADEGFLIRRVAADAVTEKGKKLCRLLGMKKRTDSDHGSEIYELILIPPPPSA